jgi:SAM-dependent methyltransferase
VITHEPASRERLDVEAVFQDGRVARPELRTAFYGSLFDRVKNEFWGAVAAGPCDRVLEIGCGPGDNLKHGLRRLPDGVRVVALDLSWESLRCASGDADLPHTIRYVRADAERLCFGSETIDLAYGLGILHHLRRPAIYEELYRVLRPGGRAVFLEPLAGNWLIDAFRRLTPGMRSPFETPLSWGEWEATGTPFAVRHREFLLTSLAAVALGLVTGRGSAKRAIDSACWGLDRHLTSRWPGLSRWCWLSILEFHRPDR